MSVFTNSQATGTLTQMEKPKPIEVFCLSIWYKDSLCKVQGPGNETSNY